MLDEWDIKRLPYKRFTHKKTVNTGGCHATSFHCFLRKEHTEMYTKGIVFHSVRGGRLDVVAPFFLQNEETQKKDQLPLPAHQFFCQRFQGLQAHFRQIQ